MSTAHMQTKGKRSTGALSDRMVNGLNKELGLVKTFAVRMRMLKNFPPLRFIGLDKNLFFFLFHIPHSFFLHVGDRKCLYFFAVFFTVFPTQLFSDKNLRERSNRLYCARRWYLIGLRLWSDADLINIHGYVSCPL